VVDEIVETLEGVLEAIKSGEIEPSHLIIGYGERVSLTMARKERQLLPLGRGRARRVSGHRSPQLLRHATGDRRR
jgi:hypothetical protein